MSWVPIALVGCVYQTESCCLNVLTPRRSLLAEVRQCGWDQAPCDECQSLNLPLIKCPLLTDGMKSRWLRQVLKEVCFSFKRWVQRARLMPIVYRKLWLNAEVKPLQKKWTKASWSHVRIAVFSVAGRYSCLQGDKTQRLFQRQSHYRILDVNTLGACKIFPIATVCFKIESVQVWRVL